MTDDFIMYEALSWLKANNNPSALASNRFGETVNAIEFVEKLYRLGAVKVSICDIWDEPERITAEGGPYADTLLVELPEDKEKRAGILEIYQQEIAEDMLNEGEEADGADANILAFWWD